MENQKMTYVAPVATVASVQEDDIIRTSVNFLQGLSHQGDSVKWR